MSVVELLQWDERIAMKEEEAAEASKQFQQRRKQRGKG